MAEFPAFLFYAEDFATGTAAMSPMEVGVYIRCLCHQWSHGYVPDDERQIARLSGAMLEEIASAWPSVSKKFVETSPGQLQNTRLEQVREDLLETSERRSKAGKRGAVKRWGKKKSDSRASSRASSRANSKPIAKSWHRAFDNDNEDDHESDSESGSETKASIKEQVSSVVSHYQGYHPRARAGSKERAKIRERLAEGSTVDDLKLAIDGCHKSPFHCGDNERGQKYQTLELIVRDASKVAAFIELANSPRGSPTAVPASRNEASHQAFLASLGQ